MNTKTSRFGLVAWLALALSSAFSSAFATDLARTPLSVHGATAPNVIFGMDDSGSMDMETLLTTNEGMFWWHESDKSGFDSKGAFRDNPSGLSSSAFTPYAYLFPVGCTSASSGGGGRRVCDGSGVYAAPPTPQFAALRSNNYNPVFYNPKLTYAPWEPATIAGAATTFANSTPSAARSHPLFASPTLDLTAEASSTSSGYTFLAMKGMKIPSGSRIYAGNKWVTLKSDVTIGSGSYTSSSYSVDVPYYPASYWYKESCSVNGTTCVSAPDSGTLKLYEIRSGQTFPSGRAYAAELQNFANWFTYSRKRKLMLAGSMGKVMGTLSGMRVGLTEFNTKTTPNVVMYDTDAADNKVNGRAVAGLFYKNLSLGGTPTRNTLKYIGEQFDDNTSVVTAACQRNASFIVTDGFANYTSVSAPTYKQATYGSGAPYATTHAGSLADISLAYYTRQLRTDLPTGLVPAAAADASDPAADTNKNLHMNTYGITLGARGKLWPGLTDAYAQPISWVNPTASGMPESIDDLWHATVNGRGRMFLATTPDETAENIQSALTDILRSAGAQGGVTFSTVNLKAGATAYLGSYSMQGWSGSLDAYSVNATDGTLGSKPLWTAGPLLRSKDWTTRLIASFNGSDGVAFTESGVGSQLGSTTGISTADAVDYLRGDRTLETTTARPRTGLMGAVINAEAVVDRGTGVVYATTGEGMVHALDQATGAELWAYAPGFVLGEMAEQLNPKWSFRTMLDGTPVLATVGEDKLLIGGRGTAGPGVYALKVSDPKAADSESEVAALVQWEFPNASTPTSVSSLLGATVGKPLVVDTKDGPVVVVASGYFPDKDSTGDGKARIFVLDAKTGELLRTLVAPAVSGDSGEAGLAALSGFLESDGKVRYVYGGDERGHLWRFDLDTDTVLRLATLKDTGGNALPITAAPELARIKGRRMVFVGTGRFLGESDFTDSQTHSFFGLWDDGTAISSRASLVERKMTVGADGTRRVTGDKVDWTTKRGWVVTLPAGEKANTDPSLASGVVAFTTNSPSKTLCSASSALYVLDAGAGLELPASAFATTPFAGLGLGSTLTSKVTLTRLSTGKLGVTTRQSDGTPTTRTLNVGAAPAPQKTSWREVLR